MLVIFSVCIVQYALIKHASTCMVLEALCVCVCVCVLCVCVCCVCACVRACVCSEKLDMLIFTTMVGQAQFKLYLNYMHMIFNFIIKFVQLYTISV